MERVRDGEGVRQRRFEKERVKYGQMEGCETETVRNGDVKQRGVRRGGGVRHC